MSLAHSDTTTENDELATISTMETFRENKSNFVEMNRGRNTNFTFGGSTCRWWVCACGSSEFREMAFEICIGLDKYSHIFFIDMIIPTIPGGE